jgi:DNA polymerase
MSDTNPSSEPLRASEIASQAAALAAHLQRSGVHWLPAANPDAVELLATHFAVPARDPEDFSSPKVSEPAVASAGQPAANKPAANKPAPVPPTTRVAPVAAIESLRGSYPGTDIPTDQRQAQLDLIHSEVSVCTKCAILSSCRTNTVFGEGSVSARVVFFGEGPGADEDRSGRPFVGKAGQLLTKMIEACGFKREETYILNTVKCRPPGNRNPEHDEIENCRDYYQRQLAIIRPEYIVCLGAVSAQELLKSKLPVGQLRGKLHGYFESKVLVTYHPAYLLRTPAAKKATWADLQLMLKDAGIEVKHG